MADSDLDLRGCVDLLLKLTKPHGEAPFKTGTEISSYVHKITKLRQRFQQFHEETTPDIELGDKYMFTGRLKFYSDKMLYIYLEVEMFNGSQTSVSVASLWPVKVTWKVEAYNCRDPSPRNSQRTLLLGEASCIFNRPRQGFKSHPNDWISINLDAIENSGLIAADGSVTLRWTIVTEQVLLIVNVQEFYNLLNMIDLHCERNIYEGTVLQCTPEDLEKLGEKLSSTEKKVTELTNKLSGIETKTVISSELISKMMERTNDSMRLVKYLLRDKISLGGGESEV